jgi:hypothetical protein
MIFSLVLVGIALLALVLVTLCYAWVAKTAFSKIVHGADDPLKALMTRGGGLEFVSVVLIVISAVILAINKIIDPQATVSILSAALGYVFGFGRGAAQAPKEHAPSSPQ